MPPGLREGGVDLPGARKTTATSDSPCSRPLNPGLRRSRNAATVAVSIRMPVQKSRGIAESWKRNETLYQIRRQIPLHPLTLRSIANAMRLEGSRPQPGLRGSLSDAKHRPETARDVDRQPEILRSPRLLITRIERRSA